jgi:carbohydrate-selective porin OprB
VLLSTPLVALGPALAQSSGATESSSPDPASPTAATSAADEAETSDSEDKKLISLLDAEPSIYNGIIRYPKYYGDPNMVRGDLFERSHLLGDWGGARDDLAASGLIVDFGLTQVFQGVVSGDSDDDTSYVGSADLWLGLDTGRAGLWSGGLIFAHGEANWGDPLTGTGAILPLNGEAIAPGEPDSIALSEIYLTQALSEQVLLIAGKVDWAAWADTSFFANNERTQFLYEGLVNNAMLGPFVPYTSWGAFMVVQVAQEHAVGFLVAQNAGRATVTGFNDFSMDEMTFAAAYTFSPKFGDLPGLYEFVGAYTSKDSFGFAIDERYLFGTDLTDVVALLPTTAEDNYAFIFTGSQYLWVRDGAQRKRSDPVNYATARRENINPVGFGLSARFGISPSDRNVIDQFYKFGIGGWGGILGRDDDNWGIGWAGSHISSDLREIAGRAGRDLDDFEHGVEAFYNFALTPAAHLSGHVQWINPIDSTKDDVVTLSARLQLDF